MAIEIYTGHKEVIMTKTIRKGYTREFLAVEKEFTPESEFFKENDYQAICRLCKWDGNEYYEDYDVYLCEFFNFAEYEDSAEVVAKSFEEIEKVCPHFRTRIQKRFSKVAKCEIINMFSADSVVIS